MCVHKHMITVSSSFTTVLKYSAFKSFAGDIRNDLYVTLEKGEFEKGNDILAFEFFFEMCSLICLLLMLTFSFYRIRENNIKKCWSFHVCHWTQGQSHRGNSHVTCWKPVLYWTKIGSLLTDCRSVRCLYYCSSCV